MAAPTLIVEDGRGLAGANSYVSLDEAQDYFDSHLWAQVWQAATGNATAANATLIFAVYETWYNALDSQSGVMPVAVQPNAGDTATVDGVTYTFVTIFTGPYQIMIGANISNTIANLASAINGILANSGIGYSGSTAIHPTVSAIGYSGTLVASAKTTGIGGNAILVAATSTRIFWATSNLGTQTVALGGGADGTTARQIAALIHATRLIDQLVEFFGAKKSAGQALQWPRERVPNPDILDRTFTAAVANQGPWVSDNFIPPRLKDAVCELALSLLVKNRTQELPQKGVTSLGIGRGALTTTFDKTDSPKPITDFIKAFLCIYGRIRGDSSSVKVVRT